MCPHMPKINIIIIICVLRLVCFCAYIFATHFMVSKDFQQSLREQ